MSYDYLASPYSHPDLNVMHYRYVEACKCFAWLLGRRQWVYSPIVHCHDVARQHSLPRDWDFWMDYDRAMLLPAKSLIILTLDGWQDSRGINQEVTLSHEIGKPISFIHPSTYELTDEP